MGRPGTATEKGIDMKDLTPAHMRGGPRNCPSIHELDDGSLLIVGKRGAQQAYDGNVGMALDEEAVIISPDLLSDYVAGEVAALKAALAEAREVIDLKNLKIDDLIEELNVNLPSRGRP